MLHRAEIAIFTFLSMASIKSTNMKGTSGQLICQLGVPRSQTEAILFVDSPDNASISSENDIEEKNKAEDPYNNSSPHQHQQKDFCIYNPSTTQVDLHRHFGFHGP